MPNQQSVVEITDHYIQNSRGIVSYLTKRAHLACDRLDDTLPWERVLDLGCGCGVHFPYYYSNQSVIAVDSDLVMLSDARKVKTSNIELIQMDITKGLLFPTSYFQVCVASGVLEHISDLVGLVLEIRRVLKPGGSLLVIQVAEGLAYRLGRRFTTARDLRRQGIDYYKYIVNEHVHSTREVLAVLDTVFERDRLVGVPFGVPVADINAYLVGRFRRRNKQMSKEYMEGLGWEGMDRAEKGLDEDQAKADLESWTLEEARRLNGGTLPKGRVDINWDPDYAGLQVREVPGGKELHIGTFGFIPGNLYQSGFREGISHELAHLVLGHDLSGSPGLDTDIRQEIQADLKGRGKLSAEALVNLTKGLCKRYKLSLGSCWSSISLIAREEFGIQTSVLSHASKILGLPDSSIG